MNNASSNRFAFGHLAFALTLSTALGASLMFPPRTAFAQESRKKKTAQQAPAASSSRGGQIDMKRSQSVLPESVNLQSPPEKKMRSLEVVKPPKSGDFYEGNGKEAEYEHILDQEIAQLFKLSRANSKSPNRGEIWLRLGERYVEKARLIDMREQATYEKKLKDFAEKKTKIRPQLNQKPAREYNEKAVQLYEWFIKDFPQDPKVDQALFFLGYNQFELGNTQLGERYYTQLVKNYPDSVFITESHFALGEYYFENEAWKKALENYAKVVRVKKARLNTFALYKSAWCLYRLNRTKVALQALEKVVRQSRANEQVEGGAGRRAVNKLRLASEALKDYVPFYAEVGDAESAEAEFQRLTNNDEKQTEKMLERLAFIYADTGNRAGSTLIFHRLIAHNPTGERAAEFQYQIVLSYATHDQKEFRKELTKWLEDFGPHSYWAKENAKNQKLVADVAKLQETTLRNWVLQQHQTAQNSRAPYSQQIANAGYYEYAKYFPNSAKINEMLFFHAELLFDMDKYVDAAKFYNAVADRDPKGPYYEKSIVNALLALEKNLPSTAEIDAKRGKSLDPIPFDPPVEMFEKAALRYIQAFPKGAKIGDIKRRLGVLYYSYNHFDKAIDMFQHVIRENPKSDNAIIAGNLWLDIYKLKNDMAGLSEKGQELLATPGIASTKFGQQVKVIVEKAGYLKAEKTESSGDAAKAGKEFEAFAMSNKSSDLAAAARFKAAVNYEKGGDFASAIRMHNLVLMTPSNDPKIKTAQNDSRNALARIYSQTGHLEGAAKQYVSYANANPKDPAAINAYYNAGVLYDGLGMAPEAIGAYDAYFAKSNKSDRVEVIFAEAELLRKKGSLAKASAYYDKYLNSRPQSQSHAIQSNYMIAHIADQLGQKSKAKQWYKHTLEVFNTATSKKAKDETVKLAAESRFLLAQDTLHTLQGVRFGTNDKQQAQAAGQVKALQAKYLAEMGEVVKFDNGPYIVAALTSGGQMLDTIADLFSRVPVPAGFQPEEAAKYKELIQQQVNGYRAQAKNSYKLAVDKAHELEVYNNWTKIAQQGLEGADSDAGELAVEAHASDWMGL